MSNAELIAELSLPCDTPDCPTCRFHARIIVALEAEEAKVAQLREALLERKIADTLVYEYFGARCEVFDSECEVCRRWKALDELTDTPFAEVKMLEISHLQRKFGLNVTVAEVCGTTTSKRGKA